MTWELLIPGIAAGLFFIGLGAEFMMHDREKAMAVELSIRKKQKEIKKFQKEKNTKAMMDANKELMGLMSQNFKLRMKTMFITFPLFIVVFAILNGMLSVGPLPAGQVSQVGVDLRNVAQSPQTIQIELASPDIQVSGTNSRTLELDDKGDSGDREQVWWNVSAPEGSKSYTLIVSANNKTDNATYTVHFSPPGSLTAGFSPQAASELAKVSVAAAPLYKPVEINIMGIQLGWYWWYIISFFILTAALSPVKNKVLWGHSKGIKHLEKMETMKEKGAV